MVERGRECTSRTPFHEFVIDRNRSIRRITARVVFSTERVYFSDSVSRSRLPCSPHGRVQTRRDDVDCASNTGSCRLDDVDLETATFESTTARVNLEDEIEHGRGGTW